MKRVMVALTAVVCLAAGSDLAAQQTTPRPRQTRQPLASEPVTPGTRNYDVVLEIPELRVDSIGLSVDSLTAHLALDARVANFLTLNAGADVSIDSVGLSIAGVVGEAYLYVDLDNVARIVNRVLTTLDRNPEIVTGLLTTVDTVVGTVGAVGQTLLQPGGLLSQTVNTLGQTVNRTVDVTGRIVERTLDTAGRVVGENVVGNVTSLAVIRETAGAAGQVVKQVRDASGAVIEFTLDAAGKVLNARVLQPATRR
ncbi:MAG: hypothetical protein ACT4O1_09090 [Gemmatimonadota bacterium]